MNPSPYDYAGNYIARADPTCPALSIPAPTLGAAADFDDRYCGAFTATVPVIAGVWAQVSPDPATTTAMLAVLARFSQYATTGGFTTWESVPAQVISTFIAADKKVSGDVRRLRKNTIHGAYLALVDAGLHEGPSPAAGIDPVPGAVRVDQRGKHRDNPKPSRNHRPYTDRVHVRPASNDEVLIIRLGAGLAGNSLTVSLSAATVAICTASATTTEAPQVLWRNLHDDSVDLPGRAVTNGRKEGAIVARTITLDTWSIQALADWRDEQSKVRAVGARSSVLYNGKQQLDSYSAQVSADQQVRKALEIADLRREPGLSAGSLRLWAAARHVTTFAQMETGATLAGIEPLTLHRQITQQGERGLQRSA